VTSEWFHGVVVVYHIMMTLRASPLLRHADKARLLYVRVVAHLIKVPDVANGIESAIQYK
jgi:hypothetical protein